MQRNESGSFACYRRSGAGWRDDQTTHPTENWGPWAVIPRSNGFHVSRESANGTRTEALCNEVGRTKIFRSRALAEAARDNANGVS
jgi:hypothetical protein